MRLEVHVAEKPYARSAQQSRTQEHDRHLHAAAINEEEIDVEDWPIIIRWWERPENAASVVNRTKRMMNSLAAIDTEFSRWELQGGGRHRFERKVTVTATLDPFVD